MSFLSPYITLENKDDRLCATVTAPTSELALTCAQELVSNKPGEDEHIGALREVKWTDVVLDGENHTLTVEGAFAEKVNNYPRGHKVKLVIVKTMSAGFSGSGSLNTVTILVLLKIGKKDFLRRIITQPDADHEHGPDEWRSVFRTEDLMPHGPKA